MVTRKSITTALVLALGLTAAVAAQDYIFTNFTTHRDLAVPASPCITQGSAQPIVYDTSIWLFYTCLDGRVIARRFFHTNDQTALTRVQPVMIIQPDGPTPTMGAAAIYDTTDRNWQNTGMTEAEWRSRYPLPPGR